MSQSSSLISTGIPSFNIPKKTIETETRLYLDNMAESHDIYQGN